LHIAAATAGRNSGAVRVNHAVIDHHRGAAAHADAGGAAALEAEDHRLSDVDLRIRRDVDTDQPGTVAVDTKPAQPNCDARRTNGDAVDRRGQKAAGRVFTIDRDRLGDVQGTVARIPGPGIELSRIETVDFSID